MTNVILMSLIAAILLAVLKLLGWDMSWCEVSAPLTIPMLAIVIILTAKQDETE